MHSTDVVAVFEILFFGDFGELVFTERGLVAFVAAVQCISFKFCLTDDTDMDGTNFLERFVGEQLLGICRPFCSPSDPLGVALSAEMLERCLFGDVGEVKCCG